MWGSERLWLNSAQWEISFMIFIIFKYYVANTKKLDLRFSVWDWIWTLTSRVTTAMQLQMKFEVWTSQVCPNFTLTMCCVSSHSFLTVNEIWPECVLFYSHRSELSLIPLIQDFQRDEEILLFDSRVWIPSGRDIKTEQGEFGYVVFMQSDNWAVWSSVAKLTVSSIKFIYIFCIVNLM